MVYVSGAYNMQIKVKKVNKNASIPEYGTEGAACFDLRACIDSNFFWIDPGERVRIPTGLAVELPADYELQVRPRSGLSFHKGIDVVFGTVDSDYRGEISIVLVNNSKHGFQLRNHERIAQGIVCRAPKVSFVEVSELADTARGVGGFGSTGVE